MRVFVASTNPGKAREFAAILAGTAIEPVGIPLWFGHEESEPDYAGNARAKASAVVRITGMGVLAEDSGLEVDALGGMPGHHSARFSGPAATDASNNAKLLRLLDGVSDRSARYRAHAVLQLPSGERYEGSGSFEGSIATAASGTNGFGYDPLFIPAGFDRTCGDLDPEVKNARSHRRQALTALIADFNARRPPGR